MEAVANVDWLFALKHGRQKAGLIAQQETLKAVDCERTFSEQVSWVGRREQLEAAITFARDGDTFVVARLDRLARSDRPRTF